jgi:hypothetical protein
MKVITATLLLFSSLALARTPQLFAQSPSDAPLPQSEGRQRGQRENDGGPRPLIGQITAIHDGTMRIAKPDGTSASVKLTGKTEFRKDRQPAKSNDFKVGDFVLVRGQENPDRSVTAEVVAGRSGGGANATGRNGGFIIGAPMGTMGKDFVVGEVKAIDPPQITVLRPDHVTQTIELNEETSLRKGRESITMADIQVGDHIVARAASPSDTFTPKIVVVIEPEQWKRVQDISQIPELEPGKAPKAQNQKPAGPNN